MNDPIHLAPVTPADRIDVLDILRGIAILGIFYMNIPFMGAAVWAAGVDVRLIGWTPADQIVWATTQLLLEGTQRGMLEFLFGVGMMILARRAMDPDGPVAVADLYYRRTLWLLLFGLADVFVLLWPGDILHVYALAALALFPFRRLPPHLLVAIGLSYAVFTGIGGAVEYSSRQWLATEVMAIEARPAGTAVTPAQRTVLADWRAASAALRPDDAARRQIATERAARTAGAGADVFVPWIWQAWFTFVGKGTTVFAVFEALGAMLIGVALWRWRIIQGGRDARFYLRLMAVAYAFGLSARAAGVSEVFAFAPGPQTIWVTQEVARLVTTLGHVALVNLVVQTRAGARLLAPFRAAGRTAFSLYFMQQIIGIALFAPFTGGLWGRFGWAGLAGIATIVIVLQLVVANLWSRWFVTGPFEWLWRSLSYLERQPLRRLRA